jgi:hypothetical protein
MFPESNAIYSAVGNALRIFYLIKFCPVMKVPITLVKYFTSVMLMNLPANKDT